MRILYGVGGEGNGHAMRSHAIITYLRSRGHEVQICASGIGERVLAPLGAIHRIPKVPLVYRDGSVAYVRSILGMLPIALRRRQHVRKVQDVCRTFRPHVIVSDYETFTAAAAGMLGIPLIAANNISLVTHTRYDARSVPGKPFALWVRMAEPLATGKPSRFVLPAFFPAQPLQDHVVVTTPPIRASIRKLRATQQGPVLVYQTSSSNALLLEELARTGIECRVYGYGVRKAMGSLSFFAFDERRFLRDLACARAVIAGGGFTLITEAIFLKKPLLCVPLGNQYEQCLNAAMVERQGYGKMMEVPQEKGIKEFFSSIAGYRRRLARVHWDPDSCAKEIERAASDLAGKE